MWATMWMMEKTTTDQATALWNVMFLSKGMNELRGVRRRREMKLRQIGSRMNAMSTWSMSAAERATAVQET